MTTRLCNLFAVLLLLAATAGAVEIPLRDGTLVEAASYTANGSYLMVVLPSGAQVAYDVGDVDLEALRAGEQAPAADEPPVAPPSLQDLALGRELSVEAPTESGVSMRISDHDVGHVTANGTPIKPAGGDDDEEEGVPADHEQGGQVVLKGSQVIPLGQGRWRVEGQVVNRRQDAVQSVQVRITATPPAGDPIIATVPVANTLGPDEAGSFDHSFTLPADRGDSSDSGAAGEAQPLVRFDVFWMQVGETKRRDDRIPRPNAVPRLPGQGQGMGQEQPRDEF